MKTHKTYKPREITKEQQERLEREDFKYLIFAIIIIFLGAIVVTCIFKLMEAGLGI